MKTMMNGPTLRNFARKKVGELYEANPITIDKSKGQTEYLEYLKYIRKGTGYGFMDSWTLLLEYLNN